MLGPVTPIWAWFGHDEPNYTTMPNGRRLLTQLASAMPVPVHARTHNLLTSGDGRPALKWGSTNAYTEDGAGDPEGCAACSVEDNPHNASRNGTPYTSYTTASFPRKLELAAMRGVELRGAVTWAFEFEGQPWFAGFRSLATNDVGKAVLNVFRMFGMMSGERVAVEGGSGYDARRITEEAYAPRPT
jgi:hypothetical protein